jgi:hypothetical protein
MSARSIVSRDMFVRVSVSAQDKRQSSWFTLPPALGRIELKAGKDLDILVTVDIPANTPFDKHGFKVLVADDASPQVDFSVSPLVTFERKQKMKGPGPWKWVALGIGIAGVVTVALILLLGGGTALGKTCDPSEADCRGGVCPPELKRCVAFKDVECDDNEQCISNKCVGGKCAPAQLGDVCYPSHSAACEGDKSGCLNTAPHRCVSFQGGPCRTPADCTGGACTKVGDAFTCGNPIGQLGCTADAQCPANQVCTQTTGGQGAGASPKACLYRGGVLCPKVTGEGQGGRLTCASQICNIRGRCAPHDNSCVPADQDCDLNEVCENNKCKGVGGGAAPPRPLKLEMLQSTTFMMLNQDLTATSLSIAKPKAASKP